MKKLLVIIFLSISFQLSAQLANIKHCSAREFNLAMDSCNQKVILDIRPDSFNGKYKIAHAIEATNKAKLNSILDTIDTDTPLFVYCVEGVRSKKACTIAQEKGFQYIFNLKKGISAYRRNGFEVIRVVKSE